MIPTAISHGPPPSDLSDYTWDDSDRPTPGPALPGGEGELADGRPLPSRDEVFRDLVQGLQAHRLVDGQELRTALLRASSPTARPGTPIASPPRWSAAAG